MHEYPRLKTLTSAFTRTLDAKPHTPVYTMHKYFARRPWNVFSEIISHYSQPEDIVLDPFCGGGVTVIEALKLKRKAVGVDVNPLATYVTKMEARPVDLKALHRAYLELTRGTAPKIRSLYSTRCSRCGTAAVADWIEWDERLNQMVRMKYDCAKCGSSHYKIPSRGDVELERKVNRSLRTAVQRGRLWYPPSKIPHGDKTSILLNKKVNFFHQLFTRRNLLALSMLFSDINRVRGTEVQEFLRFAFSSSLKWASRQSHLRGEIVEGWAMHAYWVYPRSLEINVWNTFERRIAAILRGKKYSNEHIGAYCKIANSFGDVVNGEASCLILNQSATQLSIPEESVDCIITDPPYGGNVNYSELSDFWHIWMNHGKLIDKSDEAVINRTQRKSLEDYEGILLNVFKECYRVLKPGCHLVSTFNSKDMRVVSSFVIAATRAGFTLLPDGYQYQKPIRSYTTTFHAMQIGAFVGDFVFTFVKEEKNQSLSKTNDHELENLKEELDALTEETLRGGRTEPELREMAYQSLIPFIAKHAQSDIQTCREASNFFETRISEHKHYFKSLRKTITQRRRRTFRTRQN